MRTFILLTLVLAATTAATARAQDRWLPIGDRPVQELAIDRASLRKVDTVLQVEARSAPGPLVYDIVRYQVQCERPALRTVSRAQFESDSHRPIRDASGKSLVQVFPADWMVFAPGSDGRVLTEAICRLGRERGLLG